MAEWCAVTKYLLSTRVLVILSVVFYIVSLTLPAIYTVIKVDGVADQAGSLYLGLAALLAGWLALFSFVPAWLANISYVIALANLDANNPPLKSIYTTLILALSSFLCINTKLPILGSERSNTYPEYISHFGIGFYCWLFSFLLLAVACYRRAKLNKVSVNSN